MHKIGDLFTHFVGFRVVTHDGGQQNGEGVGELLHAVKMNNKRKQHP
jgi:hypothetical protein